MILTVIYHVDTNKIMPQPNQKTVTIPLWVWEKAEQHFRENKEELRMERITSVTGLITGFILNGLKIQEGSRALFSKAEVRQRE